MKQKSKVHWEIENKRIARCGTKNPGGERVGGITRIEFASANNRCMKCVDEFISIQNKESAHRDRRFAP